MAAAVQSGRGAARRAGTSRLWLASVAVLAGALATVAAVAAAGYPPPADTPPVPEAVVSLASVSNGCGPGDASSEYRYGDDSSFVNTNLPFAGEKVWHVSFREACELHDAGYSGAEVYDGLNGGYYDLGGSR